MIDTNRVIFVERAHVTVDITARIIGMQIATDSSDLQAAMLLAWADEVAGWPESQSWVMQCRLIVDEMTSIERAHVAAVLEPLLEHLKSNDP